jgi:hypothetical protein
VDVVGVFLIGRSAAAGACAMCLVLAACGDDSAVTPKDPWAADVKAAQGQATSDLERRILADGVVSKAEYVEAVNGYVSCMSSNGVNIVTEPRPPGILIYKVRDQPKDFDTLDAKCRSGTNALIEPLYTGHLTNPKNLSAAALFAQCFVRKGLVAKGYTEERSRRDMEAKTGPYADPDNKLFNECMQGI